MTEFALIYPMLAMVALTTSVLVILFLSRVRAVREGKVTLGYFKTFQGQIEPSYTAKPARHFANLFEAPVLFYAVCLAAMITQSSGPTMIVLAWTYVAARVGHALIHLGSNQVRARVGVYFGGWLALLAMWIYLAVCVASRG
jgi:hypothetical protein